uniref:Uncharacterized protein n=1 Tax=Schistosoma mansoni TaxID=6183 RepID=A0A5K4F602_SCHMA
MEPQHQVEGVLAVPVRALNVLGVVDVVGVVVETVVEDVVVNGEPTTKTEKPREMVKSRSKRK